MKITKLSTDPIENYPYWIVQTGGRDEKGNRVIEQVNLPILLGAISDLGQDIDAIVATSDLQGTIKDNDVEYLLGEKLPEFLSMFIQMELPNIETKRIGIILCGDLYANLEKRGGRGDVKTVWREFKKYFKWVVGVAGNHDDFGETKEFEAFKREDNMHYLHGQIKEVDKIKIGGISGIIGRTDKPQRVEEKDYLMTLKKILIKQPSIVLLHQSPNAVDGATEYEGSEATRKVIEDSPPNLIFCGHSHWKTPIITYNNDTQVLNLDGRVVILIKDSMFEQK